MTTATLLPALETPALVVREIAADDARAFARFMTHRTYQRFLALRLTTPAEVASFVRRAMARQYEERRRSFHLAAECKLRRIAVGDGFIYLARGTAEIGWGVDPALWGQGIGREIGRALVALAIERLGAEQVWAKVMGENAPSLKLARGIGLKHVRTHRDFPRVEGGQTTVEIFTLSAGDYYDAPY
jgi:[ribosomal protein S5]-alanine N-acetyltransferase